MPQSDTYPAEQPDMQTYVRSWEQDGIRLSARVAPCCWMYGSPMQVTIKIGDWNGDTRGTEQIIDRNKLFADATPATVEAMTRHIALVPCKIRGCKRTAFDPVAFQHVARHGGRMGKCEECWMAKWRKDYDKATTQAKQKEAKIDAGYKAKGYVWKITAWIHPSRGDDYQKVWYTGATKPGAKTIKGWIKKAGSRLTDDFAVTEL